MDILMAFFVWLQHLGNKGQHDDGWNIYCKIKKDE